MAKEIQLAHTATGATLYALAWNAVGQVWSTTGSAFETYATANLANYDIDLTEQGTASRFYAGDFPSAIAAGVYGVSVYVRAGASPAEGDTLAGTGNIEWSGSAVLPRSTVNTTANNIEADTQDIQSRLPAALSANGNIKADVQDWKGSAVPVPTQSGYPLVDVQLWRGTTAAADPAGTPAVNVQYFGGVALSSSGGIPAVNAVQISGDAVAADNLEAAADGTGFNLGGGQVVAASVTGTVGGIAGTIQTLDALDTALNTAHGAGSWETATGFSTLTQADVRTAVGLATANLDTQLAAIAGYIDTEVGTILNHLTDIKGATFSTLTDSLEAIRDRGDAAWITATGFSTHSAADVWAAGTRTLTAGTNIQLPANGLANVTAWTVDLTGNITGNLSGSVGSVTGAVGSVTGNVGGNVTGTIGGLTAGALADLFDTDSGTTYASAVAGSVVKEIADNAGGSSLTADAIADAVWDEVLSGHLTSGSTGAALNAAGSSGDPWATSLPGAYGAGTAGFIIGTNLDATVSSRLAASGYTAPLDAAGTRAAVGLATANLDTQLGTIGTNVDAVLADTGTDGVVVAAASKTGYELAATGLDAISVADPGAPAAHTTIGKMLVALYRRFFGKVVKDDNAGTIAQYADNGTTVNSTQTFTSTGGVDTVNKAT